MARWTTFALRSLVGSTVAALVVGLGCLGSPTVDALPPLRGCSVADGGQPRIAPRGYYTNGGSVCTLDGAVHAFHGVDRPSLEWRPDGVNLSADDFATMASWGANVVRIALNQDFWLSGAALNDPTYRATVDAAVTWAEAAGLDVILDLHWSDAGDLGVMATDQQAPGYSNQQKMADINSVKFWGEVADRYKSDGRVLFELYNEPHGISWDVWLNGGSAGGFTAVGMQQLYDAVRRAGADNVVIAGGLSYAYDLSAVGPDAYHLNGYNIMYATHPYLTSGNVASGWEGSFGHLETNDFAPVIATEFGDARMQCTGDWDRELIGFLDDHKASWTAWAWYPEGCRFPSLISDWSGTPTAQGVVVQASLGRYPRAQPAAVGGEAPPDAAIDTAGDDVFEASSPNAFDALPE